MAETAADSRLENLNQLINFAAKLFQGVQLSFPTKHLGILKTIVKIVEKICYEHENVQDLVTQIRGIVSHAEFVMSREKGSRLLKGNELDGLYKEPVVDTCDKICDTMFLQAGKPSDGGLSRAKKQLEVISIVGTAETGVDSRLKNLEWLINRVVVYLIQDNEVQIGSVYNVLRFLGTIIKIMEKICNERENVENLLTQKISGVAFMVEVIKAKLKVEVMKAKIKSRSFRPYGVMEEIKAITVEVQDIFYKISDIMIMQGPSRANNFTQPEAVSISGKGKLKWLIHCVANFTQDEKVQIGSLYEELRILRTILKIMENICYEHENENVKNLVTQIRGVTSKAEEVKARLEVNVRNHKLSFKGQRPYPENRKLTEEIKTITVEVVDIYDEVRDIRIPQDAKPSDGGPSRANSTIVNDEIVVGFEDVAETIIGQLTIAKKRPLEVVSIIGMPGLGKTTLARKVYTDPYITHHFHIRAWTYVSQVYRKRELLLEILHFLVDHTDEVKEMSDEELGEKLYKSLKGKIYLIVMDDIWSIGAWNDIRVYLPNDNNGSKILFTSRLTEVGLHTKSEGLAHCLRFLTEEESWELLHEKVFQKENCPPELTELGKQISRKCEGLPLAIVVIAGLLAKNEKTEDWWKHVAGRVSSYDVDDQSQYMNTLALSYNHLPHYLKPCFLYLGAFRNNREIPIWKLISLWIAEGFIQQIGQNKLEDIAEGYLMDLIDRNLVLVARTRSNGAIKTCRMHDLLRDLCLKEAENSNFLERSHEYKHVSSSFSSKGANDQYRLCIHSDFLNFDPFSKKEPYAPVIQSFYSDVLNFDCVSLEPAAPIVRSLLCFGNLDRTPLKFGSNLVEPFASLHTLFSQMRYSSLVDVLESDKKVQYLFHAFRHQDDMKEREKRSFFKECCLFVDGYSFLESSDPSVCLCVFLDIYSLLDLFQLSRFRTLRTESAPFPWLLNYRALKLLRVLDLWCQNIFFSRNILQLVHLRYLAIQTDDFYVLPPSISNLLSLETLILGTRSSHIIVPNVVLKMVKLRHLYSKGGQCHIDFRSLEVVPLSIDGHSLVLENLQTLSGLCLCGSVQNFLARTPNLRKLGFRGHLISSSGHLKVPDLRFLGQLETLKLDNWDTVHPFELLEVMLPANLKSLTLRGTRIEWEEMWHLGKLPNLEVLKLEKNAC